MIDSAVKDFWEEQHKKAFCSYKAARLQELIRSMRLEPLEDKTVLCVGVGDGKQVQDVVEAGAKAVHAADISEHALANVSHIVHGAYLFPHFDTMPSDIFDVAISHLVIQHINNESLIHHLTNIIRALTPAGTLYLQSAFSLVGKEDFLDSFITGDMMKSGSVYRSRKFVELLITECNGVVIREPAVQHFTDRQDKIAWHKFNMQRVENI